MSHNRLQQMPCFLYTLGLVVVLFPIADAVALPEFAAAYKQNCQLCHINPTGGGMRTLYGAQFFSYMELTANPLSEFAELDSIQPQLSRNVQIGADFRALAFSTEGDQKQSSFMAMQGDIYLAITPSDRAVIYIEKGIQSSFEAFGLLRGLPFEGALKFGRFIPNYGWRFVDHKAFTREFLGFGQYETRGRRLIEDQGVEFGFYPMSWEFSVAVTNGAPGAMDSDRGKALTARAQKRLSIGPANLSLGGSYRYGELGRERPITRYAGGFWGLGMGRLAYLGEADYLIEADSTGLVISHLAVWRLARGMDINLAYDRADLNLDLKTGTAWRGRLGFSLFVTGYLELAPAYYINDEYGSRFTTAEMQLHLWF